MNTAVSLIEVRLNSDGLVLQTCMVEHMFGTMHVMHMKSHSPSPLKRFGLRGSPRGPDVHSDHTFLADAQLDLDLFTISPSTILTPVCLQFREAPCAKRTFLGKTCQECLSSLDLNVIILSV